MCPLGIIRPHRGDESSFSVLVRFMCATLRAEPALMLRRSGNPASDLASAHPPLSNPACDSHSRGVKHTATIARTQWDLERERERNGGEGRVGEDGCFKGRLVWSDGGLMSIELL